MGEYAPKAIKDMWPIIDRAYSSAQFSGILSGGVYGYHVSRNRLKRIGKSGDYSIQASIDKLGDGDGGSGIDISLNDHEMKIATKRLMDACLREDPRVQGKMREFFGTLNGRTVTGYSPYRGRKVSADSSHLWHIHISIHRKYLNDAVVCRGIAEVMADIPAGSSKPEPWDGKSFPGADAFELGQSHPAVTVLGKRLVAHGYGSFYSTGPGPVFTEVDKKAVKAFQEAQGWTGDDADGIPGAQTWALLMKAPEGASKPADDTNEDEDDPLSKLTSRKPKICTKRQSYKTPGGWQNLYVTDENNISFEAGPCLVRGEIGIRAELAKGKRIEFRLVEDNIDAKGVGHRRTTYEERDMIVGDGGGPVFVRIPFRIDMGGPRAGFKHNYARIQFKSNDKKAAITRVSVRRDSDSHLKD